MLGKTRGMEPGMIKLFACDLDGTLLNLFHTTDDKILAAIREITDAGAHVALYAPSRNELPDFSSSIATARVAPHFRLTPTGVL